MMRLDSTLSLSLKSVLTLGALCVLGCSAPSDVASVRRSPYYEVYNPNGSYAYSGYGYRPVGRSSSSAPSATTPSSTPSATSSSRPVLTSMPSSTGTRTISTSGSHPRKSPSSLYSEVRVRKSYIPRSARGRRASRSMSPRYITIHSTQNWSRGADAWRHALALKNSKLGRLSWHYTVDESVAVQHLPTSITGNHADFDGPGNRYSIGIEMCEHPGNSRTATVNRTAKLAAYLMYKHKIPLSRVVPHYHWPRYGMRPAHKNCPHFLLNNGRPGSKWRGFQAKVKKYHDQITKSGSTFVSR